MIIQNLPFFKNDLDVSGGVAGVVGVGGADEVDAGVAGVAGVVKRTGGGTGADAGVVGVTGAGVTNVGAGTLCRVSPSTEGVLVDTALLLVESRGLEEDAGALILIVEEVDGRRSPMLNASSAVAGVGGGVGAASRARRASAAIRLALICSARRPAIDCISVSCVAGVFCITAGADVAVSVDSRRSLSLFCSSDSSGGVDDDIDVLGSAFLSPANPPAIRACNSSICDTAGRGGLDDGFLSAVNTGPLVLLFTSFLGS